MVTIPWPDSNVVVNAAHALGCICMLFIVMLIIKGVATKQYPKYFNRISAWLYVVSMSMTYVLWVLYVFYDFGKQG